MKIDWVWVEGDRHDLHGLAVVHGRAVVAHVYRGFDGDFEWDAEVRGFGSEFMGNGGRDWGRLDAQNEAELAVAKWAAAEEARHTVQRLDEERWYEDHPEWDVAS